MRIPYWQERSSWGQDKIVKENLWKTSAHPVVSTLVLAITSTLCFSTKIQLISQQNTRYLQPGSLKVTKEIVGWSVYILAKTLETLCQTACYTTVSKTLKSWMSITCKTKKSTKGCMNS